MVYHILAFLIQISVPCTMCIVYMAPNWNYTTIGCQRNFPMNPLMRKIVGRFVIIPWKSGKFTYFHTPVGALVSGCVGIPELTYWGWGRGVTRGSRGGGACPPRRSTSTRSQVETPTGRIMQNRLLSGYKDQSPLLQIPFCVRFFPIWSLYLDTYLPYVEKDSAYL